MSLRARIEAASSREPVKVHVPEWGEDVYVTKLTVGELHKANERMDELPDLKNCVLVATTVTDADGVHVWDANSEEDLAAIDALGGTILALRVKVHEANGLSSGDDSGNSKKRTDG